MSQNLSSAAVVIGTLRVKSKHLFIPAADIACKGFTVTFQETQNIYDSMSRPKFEFIAYIKTLLLISNIYTRGL